MTPDEQEQQHWYRDRDGDLWREVVSGYIRYHEDGQEWEWGALWVNAHVDRYFGPLVPCEAPDQRPGVQVPDLRHNAIGEYACTECGHWHTADPGDVCFYRTVGPGRVRR